MKLAVFSRNSNRYWGHVDDIIGFKPPKYLVPGDIVRLEFDGIGVLENPVDSQ